MLATAAYAAARQHLAEGPTAGNPQAPVGPVQPASEEDAEACLALLTRAVERVVWSESARLNRVNAARLEAFQTETWHAADEAAVALRQRQLKKKEGGKRGARRKADARGKAVDDSAVGAHRTVQGVGTSRAGAGASPSCPAAYSFPNPNFYTVAGCKSVGLQRRVLDLAWLQSETLKHERRARSTARR